MEFSLTAALPILERTPRVVRELLDGVAEGFTAGTEGPDTWSPYDVIGHLIHGERTDWVPRVEHILLHGDKVAFTPFDRFAQRTASRGKTLDQLLTLFALERAASLERLAAFHLTSADLGKRGLHPELGPVTLGQLLATWVVHDLDHIVQISRVMGKQYGDAVGPWREYLRIVRDPL